MHYLFILTLSYNSLSYEGVVPQSNDSVECAAPDKHTYGFIDFMVTRKIPKAQDSLHP